MENRKYKIGDIVELINDTGWLDKGSIVKVIGYKFENVVEVEDKFKNRYGVCLKDLKLRTQADNSCIGGLKLKYFVLKPRGKTPDCPYAYASREAMSKYSECIYNVDPQLSNDINEWLNVEYDIRVKERKREREGEYGLLS